MMNITGSEVIENIQFVSLMVKWCWSVTKEWINYFGVETFLRTSKFSKRLTESEFRPNSTVKLNSSIKISSLDPAPTELEI